MNTGSNAIGLLGWEGHFNVGCEGRVGIRDYGGVGGWGVRVVLFGGVCC